MIKLAQTLSGDWIIATPNPEERYCETQLARFETGSATAPDSAAREVMEACAAYTAAQISFGRSIKVESHVAAEKHRMLNRLQKLRVTISL